MALANESHDSLPYIDAEPCPKDRAAAEKFISAELSPDYQSTLHPLIPTVDEPRFSPAIQQELARKANGLPLTDGVDLSRYEAPEPPSKDSHAKDDPSRALDEWRRVLQRAYTSSSHLSIRQENLRLLDESGKNAWLIANSQLEHILRTIEKELVHTREAVETVHKQRKITQETSKGELVGLEETWRRGVGALVDVEVAAETMRMRILDQRRWFAQQSMR
ncbi:hypothetical protein Egran_06989 [Elaphomyces granulatus]|uniref:Pre-mRNA-splicing factor SPF27 n=1 Tax=Elaphomyces granulatus TaxID=519963 RepID=A0A232LM67_9EURO|nr:hypothetical protein Egran_06989 [Elaphomyces granulatus]